MRDIQLILFVALLWLLGGAILGMGIRASMGLEWVAPCTSVSVILGMVLLLFVMREEQARRRLFGEVDDDMPVNLSLMALIAVPVMLITAGVLWLVIAQFSTY